MNCLPKNPNEDISYCRTNLKTIYVAGGCFWGVEAYMQRIRGVAETVCGYANGDTINPTYEEVCCKDTNHAEVVKVDYDPGYISLEDILKEFFQIIEPTSLNRQGGDFGSQYRTGIYYTYESDVAIIKSVLDSEQKKYSLPIVTEVLPLKCFYVAEEYHQKYLDKNPNGYCHINFSKFS